MGSPVMQIVSSALIVLLSSVRCDFYIGDLCSLGASNEVGQCQLLENCRSARQDFAQNILPKTCGFQGSKPVVCCKTFSYDPNPEIPNHTDSVSQEYSTGIHEIVVKSKQKCREYAKYGIAASSSFDDDKPICTSSMESNTMSDGSFPAKLFPHLGVIGYEGYGNERVWRCVGSLISEEFVLTAAHCLFDKDFGESTYVKFGGFNLPVDDNEYVEEFYIKERINHPDYFPPSRYNDIALLKLDRPVKLNQHIRPACLSTELTVANKKAAAIDWRKVNYDQIDINLIRSIASLVPQNYCSNSYTNKFGEELQHGVVKKTQICTDITVYNKNECEDNFGGLLQVHSRSVPCTHSILGIKSLSKGCGTGVYTRVSAYLEWIEGIVWP